MITSLILLAVALVALSIVLFVIIATLDLSRTSKRTSKTMNEKHLFLQVFQHFQGKCKGLKMKGTLIYYNGECQFNTDSHNLLFNLTTLCEILNDELR